MFSRLMAESYKILHEHWVLSTTPSKHSKKGLVPLGNYFASTGRASLNWAPPVRSTCLKEIQAPSPPENWHSKLLELAFAAEDRTTKLAPDPFAALMGDEAIWRHTHLPLWAPWIWAWPAGPRHHAPLQAWHQMGAPMTHVQARGNQRPMFVLIVFFECI